MGCKTELSIFKTEIWQLDSYSSFRQRLWSLTPVWQRLKKKLKKKTSIVDSELSADALWNKIYVNSPKNETLFLKKKSLVSLNLMYVDSVT